MRSQRHIRFLHLPLTVVTATAAALILAASPVAAAAPANDAFAGAEALTLGTPVTADTTEATPESLDLEVIQACPFGTPPGTTNTVWYAWDSGEDRAVEGEVSEQHRPLVLPECLRFREWRDRRGHAAILTRPACGVSGVRGRRRSGDAAATQPEQCLRS